MILNVAPGRRRLAERSKAGAGLQLKRLAYRARAGKLESVRLEGGTLIVTPTVGDVPTAAEELTQKSARCIRSSKFLTS